jgi:hypothetical protein
MADVFGTVVAYLGHAHGDDSHPTRYDLSFSLSSLEYELMTMTQCMLCTTAHADSGGHWVGYS